MNDEAFRQTEAALRQSEESYRRILECAPYSIMIVRLSDARFMEVNDAFCKRLGFSREEALGNTPEELNLFVDPGDQERLLSAFYRQGFLEDVEVQNQARDGRVIDNLLSAASIRFQGHDCILVLTTDITELKKTQKALGESEQKYRHILEKMEEGYYEVDLAGTFTFINEAMTRVHGYPYDELIGMNHRTYTPPQAQQHVYDTFNQVYRTGVPAKILDYPVIRKDGSTGYIETSASLLKDASGKPIGFYGVSRDITEKKEAEQALKESEERFRTIFESARDGIYLKDKNLRYTLVNPAMGRIFGTDPKDFPGKTDEALFGEEQPAQQKADQERVLRGEIIETEERRQVGGEQKTLQSIKVPMTDSNGRINGICGFVRDQTEKKRLEAQLIQAQKMEAIGMLAGGISHDFNNLMQAVLGYCQVLMQDKSRDSLDYISLQRIEQAVEQAVAFTRQLNTFARKVDLQSQPVDLNQVVKQVKHLLKRTIPKNIDIELRLAASLYTVHADPAQLQQVLLNVGVNARDAMPDGGRLIIETANVESATAGRRIGRPDWDGPWVAVSIEDTGAGMSEEIRERIFEPFFTTKAAGYGTGLGLAMVCGILENHGGGVTCQSEPDQGTRFQIYLPATRETAEAVAEPRQGPIPQGSGETILVVDDEAYLRDFIETMLTRNGYRVVRAGSGEEGLQLYQERMENISLIILDLNMPGMGGRQSLAQLRRINPKARVIVSTGDSSEADAADPVYQQYTKIVQKPYSIREMLTQIREMLAGK